MSSHNHRGRQRRRWLVQAALTLKLCSAAALTASSVSPPFIQTRILSAVIRYRLFSNLLVLVSEIAFTTGAVRKKVAPLPPTPPSSWSSLSHMTSTSGLWFTLHRRRHRGTILLVAIMTYAILDCTVACTALRHQQSTSVIPRLFIVMQWLQLRRDCYATAVQLPCDSDSTHEPGSICHNLLYGGFLFWTCGLLGRQR